LGVFLVDKYPESYHALIGTGQMVDFVETERMDYAKAMEIAKNRGDTALIEKLTANGEPPYYGQDVTWKSAVPLLKSPLLSFNPLYTGHKRQA
jgi:hypothetical protein